MGQNLWDHSKPLLGKIFKDVFSGKFYLKIFFSKEKDLYSFQICFLSQEISESFIYFIVSVIFIKKSFNIIINSNRQINVFKIKRDANFLLLLKETKNLKKYNKISYKNNKSLQQYFPLFPPLPTDYLALVKILTLMDDVCFFPLLFETVLTKLAV